MATPPGEGGIGVIRVSGPEAISIVGRLFRAKSKASFASIPSRQVIWGTLHYPNSEQILDDVLCTVMRAPHSYTGEDVVEISGHGNPRLLLEILNSLIQSGARLAERGEFSKRAFLNGKMDLTQAEGVMDAVRARTKEGMSAAMTQLNGKLGRFLKGLRIRLMDILAPIEAGIDFPEEEVPEVSREALEIQAAEVLGQVHEILSSAPVGRVLREGLRAVIVGKPNVGKSSLLNALLGQGRAIVTEIPGTTRDTIEEWAEICGIPIQLIDTAGIHAATDQVEQLGISRSKEALAQGDLMLVVLDRSSALESSEVELLELAHRKPSIVVLNKMDLTGSLNEHDIRKIYSGPVIKTSIAQNEGLPGLEEKLVEVALRDALPQPKPETPLITHARHQECLLRAKNFLEEAMMTLRSKHPLDLAAIDLRGAAEVIGEITGECYTEDLLNKIFSEFCIGK